MEYSVAPMEGLTDAIYRRLHHRYFPSPLQYYTPFFSPTKHRSLTPKELRELPIAGENGIVVTPQAMTRNPEDFLWIAGVCAQRGYTQMNLNLGCPSGTVVSKGKGCGMLADTAELDAFLETVCAQSPIPVSVKTRLGLKNPEEFSVLLEVFNRYPLAQLILHPRIRTDFYNLPLREDWFAYAAANSKNPLCRSGGITDITGLHAFTEHYPGVGVMIGRGLIGDPGMFNSGGSSAGTMEEFYDQLLEAYLSAFGGAKNAMFRMKEHWRYLLCRFENTEKLGKRLRKTTDIGEYRAITHEIFKNCPLRSALQPDWL